MKVTFTVEELQNKKPEELADIILKLSAENSELRSSLENLQAKYDQQAIDMVNMARGYSDLKTERDTLSKENIRLEKELEHQKEVTAVYARMIFKTGTESVPVVTVEKNDDVSSTETVDPAKAQNTPQDPSEPAPTNKEDEEQGDGNDAGKINPSRETPGEESSGTSGKGLKPRGRTGPKNNLIRETMKELPQRDEYNLSLEDIQKLDVVYGAGNWRIVSWDKTSHIEVIPRFLYVQNDYTPVFECNEGGNRHMLRPECPYFFPHSIYSSSLVAGIIFDKFAMALPVYRQMGAMEYLIGDSLERGNVSRMLIRAAHGCFMPVYEYMKQKLIALPYSQSDETPLQVIEGGAEKTHYLWCHVTGELRPDDPQIVLFDFEKTRSAEHLRKYFSDEFVRIVTSDCYAAYATIDTEEESITISHCWIHCRRRFYMAYCILLDVKGLSEKVIQNTPEFKLLSLMGKMFDADTPVKHAAPEVRLEVRQRIIAPLVNTFFDEAKKIDLNGSNLSSKMEEAVSYALNHEAKLRLFLDDPFIPIDNSICERSIRPVAVGRRNYLFSFSFDGAETIAVDYTLVATAQKNEADPFFYIKYVCEHMPGGIDGPAPTVKLTEEDLEALMPWSEEYKAYEKESRTRLYSMVSLASGEKPDIAAIHAAA